MNHRNFFINTHRLLFPIIGIHISNMRICRELSSGKIMIRFTRNPQNICQHHFTRNRSYRHLSEKVFTKHQNALRGPTSIHSCALFRMRSRKLLSLPTQNFIPADYIRGLRQQADVCSWPFSAYPLSPPGYVATLSLVENFLKRCSQHPTYKLTIIKTSQRTSLFNSIIEFN